MLMQHLCNWLGLLENLNTALRLMLFGQMILFMIVLTVRGPARLSIPINLLIISAIAFLIKTSPQLIEVMNFAYWPIWFLTTTAAYFVWMCADSLFDLERPPRWAMILFPVLTTNCMLFPLITGAVNPFMHGLALAASVIVVLHALYSVYKGSLDDLFQPRRRFRLCFISCIALSAAYIMIMELVFIGRAEPGWVSLSNTLLIAAVLLAISVPILTQPADLLPEPEQPRPPAPDKPESSIVKQQIESALAAAMKDRAYARTGLTIRQLAEEIKTPEHQLRAVINQRLGYKNFSTYLNGFRIEEACKRLEDPEQARIQVLTIALDTGFASLAPFNRAFKSHQGMTPTEYRKEKLSLKSNVTALHR